MLPYLIYTAMDTELSFLCMLGKHPTNSVAPHLIIIIAFPQLQFFCLQHSLDFAILNPVIHISRYFVCVY